MKIRDLFKSAVNWTKGQFARRSTGSACCPKSAEATCWCLLGAVTHCYGETGAKAEEIREKLKLVVPGRDIVAFNDNTNRSFEEIKELVEALDI